MISFLAGAASVSVVWCRYYFQEKPNPRHSFCLQPDDDDDENASWIDPWKESVKDLKSRIGELPLRRSHWPWETIRKRVFSASNLDGEDDEEDNDSNKSTVPPEQETEESSDDPSQNKSGLCIGSIFGLDVGGTLAKLVYFEQKAADYDPISPRERHYTVAASAQAVLMARRGKENASPRMRRRTLSLGSMGRVKDSIRDLHHSEASEQDLKRLYELRQESVPDDLNEYSHKMETTAATTDDLEAIIANGEEEASNNMKKSRSMFDLSQSRNRAEALDRFYNFARRLDSYREGVKDHKLSFYSRELGGEFHFIRFETRRMRNAMDLIRANNLHLNICEMGATGGGAHKYADDWEKDLGISMDKQEELDSLVAGMQFVLSTVVGECYTFRPKSTDKSKNERHKNPPDFRTSHSQASTEESSESNAGAPLSEDSDESDEEPPNPANVDEWWWSRKVQRDAVSCSSTYPYLLVSIGTGVSILRVDGPRNHTRISGSTIGGGTYWGLIRLLTDVEDFDDVMKLAERGDPSKVDMMVGDIYGQNSDALEKLGLPSNIVASSFGKLVAKEDPAKGLKQEDLARALLLMVTNNIGQVAYLNAQLHKTPRIYFVGNFLRRNKISQRRLSSAISFWSKGEMEALFLEHEGYFGALGAFLLSQNISHSDQGFFQWDKRPNETDGVGENGSAPSGPAASSHRRSKTVDV